MKRILPVFTIASLIVTILACNIAVPSSTEATLAAPIDTASSETTPVLLTSTFTPTATVTPTQTVTPSLTPTPYGCLKPSEDYTLISIYEDITISQRTLSMLEQAIRLYGGQHDLVKALTQGSYHPGVGASFGTHDEGGAVDISVRSLTDWNTILYDDLPAIILALRQAGFAAWVREQDELYDGSSLHIHAIAVGDRDLSEAAQRQLTGPEGYFRGFNGLPVDPPTPDKWGKPVICPWMIEMGYSDLRDQ